MKKGAHYQIVLLGRIDKKVSAFKRRLAKSLKNLGLDARSVSYLPEEGYAKRDRRRPLIAVFFGYEGADSESHPVTEHLINDSAVIITVVNSLANVSSELPNNLRHINAIDVVLPNHNLNRIVSLALESFRLLRRERKIFISYKRDDSQSAANQLYNALDARGFDVFIDTRSVPPAADFQDELWHRLSDSDVVVLIDTPEFRRSRWTTEELTRANATNIQILHILWPGQKEDSASSFSHFHDLTKNDFEDWLLPSKSRELKSGTLDAICDLAEALRSKAIAARHRYLVDSFCDAARDCGFTPSVQPERWVSIEISTGKGLAVVPTIGVPTSDRINYVFESIAKGASGTSETWILYDNRGILTSWLRHLAWLDDYLPAKSISLVSSYDALIKVGKPLTYPSLGQLSSPRIRSALAAPVSSLCQVLFQRL